MTIDDVKKMYDKPYRFHHTWNHVQYLIREMTNWLNENHFYNIDNDKIITYAAIFHDAVYDPKSNNNEEESCKLWEKFVHENNISMNIANKVSNIIFSTKHPEKCTDKFEKAFNRFDWMNMGVITSITKDYAKQLNEYENNIFKEFQFINVETYVNKRLDFLRQSYLKRLITKEVFVYLTNIVNKKYFKMTK